MKKDIDTFIKEHHHINYCECIIHKDGLIEYAVPSHVEMLIKITGEDRDVIYYKMPIDASPIIWLIEYTGCIAIYTNAYLKPKISTKEQEFTLQKLINSKLTSNMPFDLSW